MNISAGKIYRHWMVFVFDSGEPILSPRFQISTLKNGSMENPERQNIPDQPEQTNFANGVTCKQQ